MLQRLLVLMICTAVALSGLRLQATPVDVDADGIVGPAEAIDLSANWKGPAIPQAWQINGSSIYYNNGLVGIGTNEPDTKLQVNDGRIRIRESATLERWDLFYDPPTGKFYLQENAAFNHLVFTKGPDHRVGIGTEDPAAGTKLNVLATGAGNYAIQGDGPNGSGVVGTSGAGGNAATAGLHSGLNGIGVYGEANAGPSSIGVLGSSQSGLGVQGASNINVGVKGTSNSNIGVQGVSASSSGVEGRSSSSEGVYGYSDTDVGVQGESGTGNGLKGVGRRGVWAVSTDPNASALYAEGGGFAGNFNGNVQITQDLTVIGTVYTNDLVEAKSTMQIDHPLHPENKYLIHSSVESPEMMNIYNGNVVTNEAGYAEITLPDYFQALNKDFRYQLTVIGQFAQAIVSREIDGNTFTIQTDKPTVKVSWLVTGIRRDNWANGHPNVVEKEKSDSDLGKYLNPEAFGKPKEMGIHYQPDSVSQSNSTAK